VQPCQCGRHITWTDFEGLYRQPSLPTCDDSQCVIVEAMGGKVLAPLQALLTSGEVMLPSRGRMIIDSFCH